MAVRIADKLKPVNDANFKLMDASDVETTFTDDQGKTKSLQTVLEEIQLGEGVDLSNYLQKNNTEEYTPTDDYNPATKKYVDDTITTQIANAGIVKREIVDTLPEVSAAEENVIYMVKDDTVTGVDKYNDYMLVNGALEQIGDTSVDLSNYVEKEDGKGLFSGKFTDLTDVPIANETTAGLAKIGNGLTVDTEGLVELDTDNINLDSTNISYENTSYGSETKVAEWLDKIIPKIYYVEPKILTFTMTPSDTTYEIGSTISNIQFDWSTNKTMTEQSLTDCTVTASDTTATYSSELSATKTFTLTVGDGENSVSQSKKISFLPRIYAGAAEVPDEYNNDFVLGLSTSDFQSSRACTRTVTAADGQFIFLAIPASYGTPQISIGGFETEYELVSTFDLTNAKGYVQSYNVYKSGQSGLGTITLVIN